LYAVLHPFQVLPYRGFLDALVRIGREEGFKGYYKGLGPSLVLVSPVAVLLYPFMKGNL
jgi:hypothetical protein